MLFEVGLHQKNLYGTVVVKGGNASQSKEIIKLLLKDINKIKQYTATRKNCIPKNIQDILFPKNKINYFTEIYTPLEPKLVSINYLVLHNLLPIRSEFEVQRRVQDWLSNFNINDFNREKIIEMTNIKDVSKVEREKKCHVSLIVPVTVNV